MVVSTGSARIQLCIATFMASLLLLGVLRRLSDDLTPGPGVDLDVELLELPQRRGQVLGVAVVGPLPLLRGRAERVADHPGGRELLVVRGEQEELVALEGDVRRAVVLDERVGDRRRALGDLR